jgi:hypothetical protein
MAERNLSVDHVTIWRWVQRYAPILNQRIRRRTFRHFSDLHFVSRNDFQDGEPVGLCESLQASRKGSWKSRTASALVSDHTILNRHLCEESDDCVD